MMKRLVYISKANKSFSFEDVQALAQLSQIKNQALDITGILMHLPGLFFQILEGDEQKVDELYTVILKDPRHYDILCLKSETDIKSRLFPNWSMKAINLQESEDIIVQPVKSLLQTLHQSYSILEKYTQPAVTKIIHQGISPLSIEPHLTHKLIFFSDIFAFSTLTEKLPTPQVVDLVNQYLTIMTQSIQQHDGDVLKFMGDCVMAAFDKTQGDAVIKAALMSLERLAQLRNKAQANEMTKYLYTGIGITYGEVIEGNMGTTTKMDYTLLGDAVNLAARLESLTRQLPHFLAIDDTVISQCQEPWKFISLGDFYVKGKEHKSAVYSIETIQTLKTFKIQDELQHFSQKLEKVCKVD